MKGFSLLINLCLLLFWTGCWENVQTDTGRVWKPDSTSEFEVGTQIRPWTIVDEGMTYILDKGGQEQSDSMPA